MPLVPLKTAQSFNLTHVAFFQIIIVLIKLNEKAFGVPERASKTLLARRLLTENTIIALWYQNGLLNNV